MPSRPMYLCLCMFACVLCVGCACGVCARVCMAQVQDALGAFVAFAAGLEEVPPAVPCPAPPPFSTPAGASSGPIGGAPGSSGGGSVPSAVPLAPGVEGALMGLRTVPWRFDILALKL
jgi:hypothetical protein